MKNDDIIEYYI